MNNAGIVRNVKGLLLDQIKKHDLVWWAEPYGVFEVWSCTSGKVHTKEGLFRDTDFNRLG